MEPPIVRGHILFTSIVGYFTLSINQIPPKYFRLSHDDVTLKMYSISFIYISAFEEKSNCLVIPTEALHTGVVLWIIAKNL